ncbi:hypothetical protein AB0C80_18810 [Streptomyces anthocyanicus]|uniref:hypothetical protein n=1 Tax=Streptomyces TaxID=1883 RepID=UPI0034024131
MATYERSSGAHVAERIRAVPGSEEDQRLSELVAKGSDGWRRTDVGTEPAVRPNKSASKKDWVAYAVSQGADEAEAESATRDELAEAYGDTEPQ